MLPKFTSTQSSTTVSSTRTQKSSKFSNISFLLLLCTVNVSMANKSLNNNHCPMDFVVKQCDPLKTFQTCQNGTCVCPTNFKPAGVKDNLSIDTYWDSVHLQCVSKVSSVCYYLPPSFLVSQPFRCVARNADCIHAKGQFKGVGICTCDKGYIPAPSNDSCVPINGAKIATVSSGSDGPAYNTEEACNWKFQCPHLQDCVNGRCKCPKGKEHDNGYRMDMVWNKETHTCESTVGSYCNNANFQDPQRDQFIKSILRSMLEVKCVAGLQCDESSGIEIGICKSGALGGSIQGKIALLKLTLFLQLLIYFMSLL